MGERTGITWTDHTFNPWVGCVEVSPACDLCYARNDAARFKMAEWAKDAPRKMMSEHYWNEPLRWNRKAQVAGAMRRVFCGSMCDVLEDRRDLEAARERLWNLIEATPNLEWLLVSKRPQNFLRFWPSAWRDNFPENVRAMTTVESPEYLWRVEALLKAAPQVNGVSYEPALAEVDFSPYLDTSCPQNQFLSWLIIGGESQPGCRPMKLEWARRVIADCKAHGVPVFVKQLGGHPNKWANPAEWPLDLRVQQFPGREWNEMPK